MSLRLCFIVFLLFLSSQKVFASNKENFVIATWNLQHWMSANEFAEWKVFCESSNWKDPEDRYAVYHEKRHLPYCNAMNGQKYPAEDPPVSYSKPVHDVQAWEEKRRNIQDTLEMISPDIIAFQEVSSKEAVLEVLGFEAYEVFITQMPNTAHQLAFAVRKKLINNQITSPQFAVFEDLAVTAQDGHAVRPGAILNLSIYDRDFALLNIHLKSGCPNNPISKTKPDSSEYNKNSCVTLAKQVPILEGWVESHSTTRAIVLGDFNRRVGVDLQSLSARFDGSLASDPHKDNTQYASLFREISDGVPELSDLHILKNTNYASGSGCTGGIDHISINEFMAKAEKIDIKRQTSVSMPFANGKSPKEDEVKTSDHCPVITQVKIKKEPQLKSVAWMDFPNKIEVSDYSGKPISTWLFGYNPDSISNEKIYQSDCELVQHQASFACMLLREQNREFSLPDDIAELQTLLSTYYVPKVHRVVNGEHLIRYHHFLKDKGLLSTALLEKKELRFVPSTSAPEADNSSGKFIRPHIIQAAARVGVVVDLGKYSKIYNVGYLFGKRTPGRSYGISVGNVANDISYNDLFDDLDRYLRFSSEVEITKFYTVLIEVLLKSDVDGLKELSAKGRMLLTDVLAVYIAEGFRFHTNGSSQFHDDLITVLALAPWAIKNNVVINKSGIVPMPQEGLGGFIVKVGNSSGLGFARDDRETVQRQLCDVLSNQVEETALITALSHESDCVTGIARFLRRSKIEGGQSVNVIDLVDWFTKELPAIKYPWT